MIKKFNKYVKESQVQDPRKKITESEILNEAFGAAMASASSGSNSRRFRGGGDSQSDSVIDLTSNRGGKGLELIEITLPTPNKVKKFTDWLEPDLNTEKKKIIELIKGFGKKWDGLAFLNNKKVYGFTISEYNGFRGYKSHEIGEITEITDDVISKIVERLSDVCNIDQKVLYLGTWREYMYICNISESENYGMMKIVSHYKMKIDDFLKL